MCYQPPELPQQARGKSASCVRGGAGLAQSTVLHVYPQDSARLEKEKEPIQNPCRTGKGGLSQQVKLCSQNDGKLESEGKTEDDIDTQDEEKSMRKKSQKWRGSQSMRKSTSRRDSDDEGKQ